MSKIGREVLALVSSDMGQPQVYEPGALDKEIEAEQRKHELSKYSIEELEQEIDSRCKGTN